MTQNYKLLRMHAATVSDTMLLMRMYELVKY